MIFGISASAASVKNAAPVLDMFEQISHLQVKIPAERDARVRLEDDIALLKEKYPRLGVSTHAFSNLNLAEPIKTVREAHLALAEDAIRLTADIGGKFTVFHAGSVQGRNPVSLRASALNTLCDSVESLLDIARDVGVELHLENIYPAPLRSELVRLFDRVQDYRSFTEMLEDDMLKYCFDFGHAMIDDRGLDIFDEYLDKIGSIHLHENDRANDLHLAPTGLFDWGRYFDKLSKVGYDGCVIIETKLENVPQAMLEISQYT